MNCKKNDPRNLRELPPEQGRTSWEDDLVFISFDPAEGWDENPKIPTKIFPSLFADDNPHDDLERESLIFGYPPHSGNLIVEIFH